MANTVPNPLLGRFVARVKVTVQSVATDGTLTDSGGASDVATIQDSTGDPYAGSPTDLTISVSLLAELDFGQGSATENIPSVDRPFANHVRLRIAPRCTITEIRRQAADSARLAAVWHQGVSRYVKYEFARAGQYFTVYGRMNRCREDAGKGQNLTQLTIGPCGIAPTLTTGVRSS
jgi:hypothetical protein